MIKKEIRVRVHEKYGRRCAYCGKHIDYKAMQVDHLHPQCMAHFYESEHMKKRYGLRGDSINSFENLMPSCRRCNHYKRAYKLEDFRDMIITINDRVLKNYIAKVALDFGTIKTVKWDGVFYFERLTEAL